MRSDDRDNVWFVQPEQNSDVSRRWIDEGILIDVMSTTVTPCLMHGILAARNAFNQEKVRCVVIDCTVGLMEAVRLAKDMRAHSAHQDTVFIAVLPDYWQDPENFEDSLFHSVFSPADESHALTECIKKLLYPEPAS